MRIDKLLPELIFESKGFDSNFIHCLFNHVVNGLERMPEDTQVLEWDHIKDIQLRYLCSNVMAQKASHAFAKCLFHYKKNKGQDYIISKDFFDTFKKISLDKVQFKHIPKYQYGFVELPYCIQDKSGANIKNFMFYTGSVHEWFNTKDESTLHVCKQKFEEHYQNKSNYEYNEILCLAWICEDGDIGYSTHPFASGDTYLKEYFKGSTFFTNILSTNINNQDQIDGFSSEIAIMVNILAYINSGDPDLRQFRNNFKFRSPNSQKVVRKDQNLSRSDITLIGYGWKKPNLYTKENWGVGPYWATRRCGPQRSLEKLVLVSGSLRHRKNFIPNNIDASI